MAIKAAENNDPERQRWYDRVNTLLDDPSGHRCLTVTNMVSQSLEGDATTRLLSRTDASSVLRHVVSENATEGSSVGRRRLYHPITLAWSETTLPAVPGGNNDAQNDSCRVPCTVFSLRRETQLCPPTETEPEPQKSFLYAVAASRDDDEQESSSNSSSRQMWNVHETALASWRDKMLSRGTFPSPSQSTCFHLEMTETSDQKPESTIIAAAPELREALAMAWQHGRDIQNDAIEQNANSAGNNGQRVTSSLSKRKKTAVTKASSFFGSTSTTSKTSKLSTSASKSDNNSTSRSTKAKPTGKSTVVDSSKTGGSSQSKHFRPTPKSPETNSSSVSSKAQYSHATKQPHEEKENKTDRVGNADDFVGDIDDDDSEEEDNKEPPKAPALAATKSKQPALSVSSRSADLDHSEAPTHPSSPNKRSSPEVASNAGTKASVSQPSELQPSKKKRRKKLRPKTTVDASGYLHTEMEEVWEDVPTDEETERPKAVLASRKPLKKSSASTKKKSSMKQGSINSFFQKK